MSGKLVQALPVFLHQVPRPVRGKAVLDPTKASTSISEIYVSYVMSIFPDIADQR